MADSTDSDEEQMLLSLQESYGAAEQALTDLSNKLAQNGGDAPSSLANLRLDPDSEEGAATRDAGGEKRGRGGSGEGSWGWRWWLEYLDIPGWLEYVSLVTPQPAQPSPPPTAAATPVLGKNTTATSTSADASSGRGRAASTTAAAAAAAAAVQEARVT